MTNWTHTLDALEQNKVTSPNGKTYSLLLEVSFGRQANERFHASEYIGNGEFRKIGNGEGYQTQLEAVSAIEAYDLRG